jgi:hypothetical protein
MNIAELKSLSVTELSERLNITIEKAQMLKNDLEFNSQRLDNILKYHDILSKNSLTDIQAAEKIGVARSTVAYYRVILMKYDLLKPKKRGRKSGGKIGSIKKLCKAYCPNERYVNININELEAAGVNPKKDYNVIVEPQNMGFIIRVFDSKNEANNYKKRKSKS